MIDKTKENLSVIIYYLLSIPKKILLSKFVRLLILAKPRAKVAWLTAAFGGKPDESG